MTYFLSPRPHRFTNTTLTSGFLHLIVHSIILGIRKKIIRYIANTLFSRIIQSNKFRVVHYYLDKLSYSYHLYLKFENLVIAIVITFAKLRHPLLHSMLSKLYSEYVSMVSGIFTSKHTYYFLILGYYVSNINYFYCILVLALYPVANNYLTISGLANKYPCLTYCIY